MTVYVGDTFSRWTVIELATSRVSGRVAHKCRCECGTVADVIENNLARGKSKSCGCYQREVTVERSTKHGHAGRGSNSPEYWSWLGMRDRCYDSRHKDYHRYGGRGIKVCDRWLGDRGFINFIADMGEKRTPDLTLDRREVDGDYAPENCRWADRDTQIENRSVTLWFEFEGRRLTLKQWAEEIGCGYDTLYNRLVTLGWSVEKAIMTPIRKVNR